MAQEKLWPAENDGVIREIIPGGSEDRQYFLYPNSASIRLVRRLEKSRFIPKLLVAMVDDSMPVDGSCLDDYPTDEFEQVSTEMLHDTISAWRENEQEFHDAA